MAAAAALPSTAHAIRPNFDGERGFEVYLGLGAGGFFDSSSRFLSSPRAFMGTTPMTVAQILSPGFLLQGGVGWRFFPLLSAGIHASAQVVGSADVDTRGVAVSSSAGAVTAGVYVRFYPMPLILGTLSHPRAIFQGAGDTRRLDPWISLGFNLYEAFSRTTERATATDWVRWTLGGLGVPVDIGFDWRVVEPLALSLAFGVTPWIQTASCGVADQMAFNMPPAQRCQVLSQFHTISPDGNVRDDYTATDTASGTNVSWHLTLGVRYTLTP